MHAVWIEIPVKDIERALSFYQTVFEFPAVQVAKDDERQTATMFNMTPEGKPGISLNQTKNFAPSDRGPLVYIDAGADPAEHLRRIEAAGGKVIEAKSSMGEAGSCSTFLDTEGNMLALYSYP